MRCNMLCRVVLHLLLDPPHSFAVQILLLHSLVEFVKRPFLVEFTNRLFKHRSFLLTYEQDHEVLMNHGLLKMISGSRWCVAHIY